MAKKYNHRRAEEEFKKMKKKDEKFMRENGRPETKILIMRAFDRILLIRIEDFMKE